MADNKPQQVKTYINKMYRREGVDFTHCIIVL